MLFLLSLVIRVLANQLVLSGADEATDLKILVLRHQRRVLRRQAGRPRFTPLDRVLLAPASRALPRQRWTSLLLVTPKTLVHLRRTSSRCQRSSVLGVTSNSDVHRCLGSARLAGASRTRSSGVNLGRPAWRRSTRRWCRRTRIFRSVASSAPERTSRRASTRMTNESRKSIGGWYGVPGHDANPSFRAPQPYICDTPRLRRNPRRWAMA